MGSHAPNKYDRQLRLWAQDGQTRLGEAHVCLVNATAAGAETLKNLVLPGIGAFTIIDEKLVEADDLSGNFFLESADLGANIAAAMAHHLSELNPDVKGSHLAISIDQAVRNPQLWTQFSVVVLCGHINTETFQHLQEILWLSNTPLLVVATAGFYASLTVISRETTIVDTHDPSKTYDLRIDCRWPELSAYAASYNMELLDDTEHAHVPYIVIFLKALDRWKQDHGDKAPVSYAEKREFRSNYVEKMSRHFGLETNFLEASQAVHRALQVTRVPASIREFVERASTLKVDSSTPDFWLYVRALGRFLVVNEDKLPLPGNIPDMASTTSNYVALQQIYRKKAEADKLLFITELGKIYAQAGKSADEICESSVATFCKNAAFLHVSNGTNSLSSDSLLEILRSSLNNADGETNTYNDLTIYFGMLALHQWINAGKHGDFEAFAFFFEQITTIPCLSFSPAISNTLKEIFAHSSTSYHNICSLIGGVAGQEALKIATAQYIPLDNLYIFDGVRSTSSKWKI